MSDFHLVDPQGWVYDLHSIYSAYMGHFQLHSLPWHDRTWGQFFETFEQFLTFSWPVITVTDARTNRAHIVTRVTSVTAFLKMIKIRFGESLPQVDNMLLVTPLETSQRLLRHVNDWSTYKKLHSALPAVALAALKARVRAGDPNAIRDLWASRDKTFLAIDFECLESNVRTCTQWGYAAIRSSHLESVGAWPPVPSTNYRKGHYIVAEYAEILNKAAPSQTRQYAFGKSQMISKAKMPLIIQSILSGLVSPESDMVANNVVLVGHGVQALLQRLEDMKIKLPVNVLVVDIAYFERALFVTGERGSMVDRKSGSARLPESMLSLGALLHSLGIDLPCALHNAGNDAFMALVAFQRMAHFGGGAGQLLSVLAHSTDAGDEGKSNRKGEGSSASGRGHVKRAASVAARLFRPLGGARSEVAKSQHAHTAVSLVSGNEVDEMGILTSTRHKRASVLSAWTFVPTAAPADKSSRRASQVMQPRVVPTARDGDGNTERASTREKRASVLSTWTSPLFAPAAAAAPADKSDRRASQGMQPRVAASLTPDEVAAARRSTSPKQSSMFSPWTSPLVPTAQLPPSPGPGATDRKVRRASQGSLRGGGMWLTSSVNTRRHSAMPLRSVHEDVLGG